VRGQRLKIWEQNRSSNLHYTNGQKVWLSFLPENTLVLPKD